jgi:hypothetical protein
MNFAGGTCNICGEKIVFANEAKFCSRCETVAHVGCGGNVCGLCGDNLQCYAPPQTDPLRDAILPRVLRPVKTGAAAFAILFIFLFMLLLLYLLSLA